MSETASVASLIPVSILTGFLGSGKTTLLNHLLHHPQMGETAVLINEFGEVALDHLLVESISGDVVVLGSGCICCTVRSDMAEAMRDLYFRRVRGLVPEFTRVLIETTGLADPAPILHTLMTDPLLSARYRLDGIITTVDAVNMAIQLDTAPEAARQIAVADRLVLTKGDLVPSGEMEEVLSRLRRINPAAPLVQALNGQVEPGDLLDAGLFRPQDKHPDVAGWLRDAALDAAREEEAGKEGQGHDCHDPHCTDSSHAHHHHGHQAGHGEHHHHGQGGSSRHDDHIHSFVLTFGQPVDWNSLVDTLEMIITCQGQNILRVKGIINARGEGLPLVIHGVQHVFHPPVSLSSWPDDDRRSRLVFITRDIPREVILRAFAEAPGLEPC